MRERVRTKYTRTSPAADCVVVCRDVSTSRIVIALRDADGNDMAVFIGDESLALEIAETIVDVVTAKGASPAEGLSQ